MFNPFNVLHRPARMEIIFVFGNIFGAPFTPVKFRHFFLADVMTSARIMYSDATSMVCFFTVGDYNSYAPLKCIWASDLNYFWAMWPYWNRFW